MAGTSGQTKRSAGTYSQPTVAIASPPATTTLVGATSSARPWPMIQAVMVLSRLTWAKSANGASNGPPLGADGPAYARDEHERAWQSRTFWDTP